MDSGAIGKVSSKTESSEENPVSKLKHRWIPDWDYGHVEVEEKDAQWFLREPKIIILVEIDKRYDKIICGSCGTALTSESILTECSR